jgi:hypothetical protein
MGFVKKIFIAIIALFALTACLGSGEQVTWSKTSFHQLDLNGEEYYFLYPEEASLNEFSDGVKIFYDGCKIFAGSNQELFGYKQFLPETKTRDDLEYTAWYKDNEIVAYDARIISEDYLFRVGDGTASVSSCTALIDSIAGSFTSELGYVNDKYDFSLILPADFDVEYFPDDEGLVLRKWVKVDLSAEDIEEGKASQYKVEIVVMPFENVEGYDDVSSFVGGEYSGYTIEFNTQATFSGFFVEEGAGDYAVRHFFTLDSDDSFIFEAYLKLPSANYSEHKEVFDELINQMEIF